MIDLTSEERLDGWSNIWGKIIIGEENEPL